MADQLCLSGDHVEWQISGDPGRASRCQATWGDNSYNSYSSYQPSCGWTVGSDLPNTWRRIDECLPKISYTIQADGSLQQEELKESDPQTLEAPADVFYLHGTMEGSIHLQRLVGERIASDEAVLKRLVAVHAPGMGQWIDPSPLPLDAGAGAERSVAIWAAATPQAPFARFRGDVE
eukprot:Skav215116  [mRNA]  locus=scaffold1893:322555:331349:- [translate_table: standard]